jgi:hypothetical protein
VQAGEPALVSHGGEEPCEQLPLRGRQLAGRPDDPDRLPELARQRGSDLREVGRGVFAVLLGGAVKVCRNEPDNGRRDRL